MAWRLLPFSEEPMGRQLALSEALLAELATSGQGALRWYVPRERALVLGNGQKQHLVAAEACAEAGVRVYRRTSGGTAVLVTEDLLSLDVALPATHALATGDVVRAYEWIGEVWAEALRSLGVAKATALPVEAVRAQPALPGDDVLRLACYGTLSPWEVVVGRRKLVGLCQVRRRAGALYQVGIYLRFAPAALGALLDLNNNRRKTLATRLHNATVGLDVAAGTPIAADDLRAAVEQALVARTGEPLLPATYTTAELVAAEHLERERFAALV